MLGGGSRSATTLSDAARAATGVGSGAEASLLCDSRIFHFDVLFEKTATDDEVFAAMRDDLSAAISGEAVCIIAYGATGSGKTHTLTHVADRTARELGRKAKEMQARGQRLEITVQLVEIYNEQLRDLLTEVGPGGVQHEAPRLKTTGSTSCSKLEGAVSRDIPGETADAMVKSLQEILKSGQSQRATSATAVHGSSSRSHLVMSLTLSTRDAATGLLQRAGKLSLVDLAGSERLKRSEAVGDRFKEATHINRSLSALADVVTARERKVGHVPYRNSKLTHLLQDSLGGQQGCRTVFIVAVPPTREALAETLHSLQFSQRLSALAEPMKLCSSREPTGFANSFSMGGAAGHALGSPRSSPCASPSQERVRLFTTGGTAGASAAAAREAVAASLREGAAREDTECLRSEAERLRSELRRTRAQLQEAESQLQQKALLEVELRQAMAEVEARAAASEFEAVSARFRAQPELVGHEEQQAVVEPEAASPVDESDHAASIAEREVEVPSSMLAVDSLMLMESASDGALSPKCQDTTSRASVVGRYSIGTEVSEIAAEEEDEEEESARTPEQASFVVERVAVPVPEVEGVPVRNVEEVPAQDAEWKAPKKEEKEEEEEVKVEDKLESFPGKFDEYNEHQDRVGDNVSERGAEPEPESEADGASEAESKDNLDITFAADAPHPCGGPETPAAAGEEQKQPFDGLAPAEGTWEEAAPMRAPPPSPEGDQDSSGAKWLDGSAANSDSAVVWAGRGAAAKRRVATPQSCWNAKAAAVPAAPAASAGAAATTATEPPAAATFASLAPGAEGVLSPPLPVYRLVRPPSGMDGSGLVLGGGAAEADAGGSDMADDYTSQEPPLPSTPQGFGAATPPPPPPLEPPMVSEAPVPAWEAASEPPQQKAPVPSSGTTSASFRSTLSWKESEASLRTALSAAVAAAVAPPPPTSSSASGASPPPRGARQPATPRIGSRLATLAGTPQLTPRGRSSARAATASAAGVGAGGAVVDVWRPRTAAAAASVGSVSSSPPRPGHRTIGASRPAGDGAGVAGAAQRRGADHSSASCRGSATSIGSALASGRGSVARGHAQPTVIAMAASPQSARSGRPLYPSGTGSRRGAGGGGAGHRSQSGSQGRCGSPREYIVEVITQKQAREMSVDLAPPEGPSLIKFDEMQGPGSPEHTGREGELPQTPKSPQLQLLCPGKDGEEDTMSLPGSDSSVSVSSNDGDIRERLYEALKIERRSAVAQRLRMVAPPAPAQRQVAAPVTTVQSAPPAVQRRQVVAAPVASGSAASRSSPRGGGGYWSGSAAPPPAAGGGRAPIVASPSDRFVASGIGIGGSVATTAAGSSASTVACRPAAASNGASAPASIAAGASAAVQAAASAVASAAAVAQAAAASASGVVAQMHGQQQVGRLTSLTGKATNSYSPAGVLTSSWGAAQAVAPCVHPQTTPRGPTAMSLYASSMSRATVPAASSPRGGTTAQLTPRRQQQQQHSSAMGAYTSVGAQPQRISFGQPASYRQCLRR